MKTIFASAAALVLGAQMALAGGHEVWTSVPDESRVAFGSIKKDLIGEVSHFNGVTGTVNEKGEASVDIDLASVDTYIDIRNERMTEHVFQSGAITASLMGEVENMDAISEMEIGSTMLTDFYGVLAFGGSEVDIFAEMMVARLGEDRVLVSTADFIMLAIEDLGVTAGIDKLMELAQLPSITRVTPVSIRMVFEK